MIANETQRFAQVVAAALSGKAIDYLCSNGTWSRIEKPDNMGWDCDSTRYRIAKERQPLGSIWEGDGLHTNKVEREVYIDQSGLHVGCTTISFERVREIARACKAWQNGTNGQVKSRREAWVLTRKLFDDDDLGWAFPTKEKADLGARNNPDTTGILHMCEVLPGEEDL